MKALARSIPGGSRSRPAPTTCSATPPSPARSRRIGVATGEACQNRVIFKQLLQADAIRFCQVDCCRMGGVNEVLVDHADGREVRRAGLPARRRRRASASTCSTSRSSTTSRSAARLENRVCEYVDHLHEHFVDPVRHRERALRRADAPGYSITMKPESLDEYEFPGGARLAQVTTAADAARPSGARVGHVRWIVCALLFFATTINYVDRQVIGILKPTLRRRSSAGRTSASTPPSSSRFQLAYAIGLLLAGRVMDSSARGCGFALAVVLWSIAAIGHAVADWFPWLQLPTLNLDATTGLSVVLLTGAAAGFALARFLLGPRRSGQLPGLDQDRGRVVPEEGARVRHRHLQLRHQRRRARRRRSSCPGSRSHWGWQWAFIVTGAHRLHLARSGGCASTARPRSTRASPPAELRLHPQRSRRSRSTPIPLGRADRRTARPGPSPSASS